jgi:hypothetical protein
MDKFLQIHNGLFAGSGGGCRVRGRVGVCGSRGVMSYLCLQLSEILLLFMGLLGLYLCWVLHGIVLDAGCCLVIIATINKHEARG